MKDLPSKAQMDSVKDGVIALSVDTAEKKLKVRLDVKNQKVELQ
jgi:uncharacterized protein with FMN-binding domain